VLPRSTSGVRRRGLAAVAVVIIICVTAGIVGMLSGSVTDTGTNDTASLSPASPSPMTYQCGGTEFQIVEPTSAGSSEALEREVPGSPYRLMMLRADEGVGHRYASYALLRLDHADNQVWCRLLRDGMPERAVPLAGAAVVGQSVVVTVDYGDNCVFRLRYRTRDGVLTRYSIVSDRSSITEPCRPTDGRLGAMAVEQMIARAPTLETSLEGLPNRLQLACEIKGRSVCDPLYTSESSNLRVVVRGISFSLFSQLYDAAYRFRVVDNFGNEAAISPGGDGSGPHMYSSDTPDRIPPANSPANSFDVVRPGKFSQWSGSVARYGPWRITFEITRESQVVRSASLLTHIVCDRADSELRQIRCAR
jgi:hypothetical protein